MSEDRFCRDCVHKSQVNFGDKWHSWECKAPQNITDTINLVSGEYFMVFPNCISARAAVSSYACGPLGNWFEEMPQVDYTKLLLSRESEGRARPEVAPLKRLEIGKDI